MEIDLCYSFKFTDVNDFFEIILYLEKENIIYDAYDKNFIKYIIISTERLNKPQIKTMMQKVTCKQT